MSYDGPERRMDMKEQQRLMHELGGLILQAGARVSALEDLRSDVRTLGELVTTLDATIKSTFVSRDELEARYPDYGEVSKSLHTLERKVLWGRWRSMLIGGLAIILGVWLALNVADTHTEKCGPANRPNDADAKTWCDWLFPFHDHPLQPDADRELVDRLLRDLGRDPEDVRRGGEG